MAACPAPDLSFLTAEEANAIDVELMSTLGFSIDQLMELAGLSCATSLAEQFPLDTHPRVLIVCGPGNNGGDGLVAARHLHHFGYSVVVCYPKRTAKPLYEGLVTQLDALGISVLAELPAGLDGTFDVVLDAIFGFSFKGDVRPPFDTILAALSAATVPIASVDIPSGWNVNTGPPQSGPALRPRMLISLTAPKLCAKSFQGAHFLGGRFVPPKIASDYKLVLPKYPGVSMHVKISDGAAP